MKYQDINAQTIDQWVEEGWEWGIPIDHQTYENAKDGKWDVLLSPTKPVPKKWFGDLKEKKILGLASGGGQQMPVFAALGNIGIQGNNILKGNVADGKCTGGMRPALWLKI